MTERAHLSIREVLDLLVVEFPDVTISKIRFLESRGLIHPERTPSGYRKFYEPDVERLRWILRQQREHFLPLKVIKGRLDAASGIVEHEHVEASLFDGDSPEPPAEPATLVGAGAPSKGRPSNGGPPKVSAGAAVPVGQPAVPVSAEVSRPGALHAVAAGTAPAS
ncbi:MAG: MerR family transcriptional regulator, partial [Acidimicrobiales bacterium]